MTSRVVGTLIYWDGDKIVKTNVYEHELHQPMSPDVADEYEADRKRLAELIEKYGGWIESYD